MSENKTETNPCTCVDPSVLELIRDLAQALQAHHLGFTTTEPFARTHYRDLTLIDQAEDFLMVAQGKPQHWRVTSEPF